MLRGASSPLEASEGEGQRGGAEEAGGAKAGARGEREDEGWAEEECLLA